MLLPSRMQAPGKAGLGATVTEGLMHAHGSGGRLVRALVVMVCCTAFGLAACGRRSALEPPPSAASPAPAATASEAGQPADWRTPPPAQESEPSSQPRNRGFILDPLLN